MSDSCSWKLRGSIRPPFFIADQMSGRRRSGLQGDVLQLYRGVLRAAKMKDEATFAFARERFRESAASVKRSEFKRIEFQLRQGHKRLKLLSMPGVTSAGSLVGSNGGHAANPNAPPPRRSFSSAAYCASSAAAASSASLAASSWRPRTWQPRGVPHRQCSSAASDLSGVWHELKKQRPDCSFLLPPLLQAFTHESARNADGAAVRSDSTSETAIDMETELGCAGMGVGVGLPSVAVPLAY